MTYSGGEELFGLAVTEYPDLMQIRRELNLLQKLYGLYNDVIDTVNGYYDILWVDVNIEKINIELQDFQTRWELLKDHLACSRRRYAQYLMECLKHSLFLFCISLRQKSHML